MEFKQVIVSGEVFNVCKVTKPVAVVNYFSLDPTVAAPGDFIVRDRFMKLYVLTPQAAAEAFGSRLEVFE